MDQKERLAFSQLKALDLDKEDVFQDMEIAWSFNTHREVFDSSLFQNKKGCSLENLKLRLNTQLPVNERLTDEEVFALKPHRKELVSSMRFNTVHRTFKLKAQVREEQGKDIFKHIAADMVKEAPFSAAKDQHHFTQAELEVKVSEYLAKLKKGLAGEDEPEEGVAQEDDSDDDSEEEDGTVGLGQKASKFASSRR